jgi:hypothetical protein
MVARRAWLRHNPYDEELTRAEDRDLWCRTVQTSRFAVVPSPLYVVRIAHRDVSFLAGYLESQRQNRILFRRHGLAAVGPARTARLWTASHLKEIAMHAAVRAGVTDRLVRRRGRSPTADERALIAEAVEAARQSSSIRTVVVPRS